MDGDWNWTKWNYRVFTALSGSELLHRDVPIFISGIAKLPFRTVTDRFKNVIKWAESLYHQLGMKHILRTSLNN
jgi:hypothetical protein